MRGTRLDPDAGGASPALYAAGLGAVVLLLVLLFVNRHSERLERGETDLRLYVAAARILAGPAPDRLYDWEEQQRQQAGWQGGSSPYVNPPVLAALFVPIRNMPPNVALFFTVLVETAALTLAARLAGSLAGGDRWRILKLAALATPLTLQIWLDVQPAPLATLAWAGFALCWLRGDRTLAALWLVTGLAVKPHLMLPLCLYVLFSRDGRAIAALAGGAVLLMLASWALIGVKGLERYPAILSMLANNRHWAVNASAMPNLRGMLSAWFGDTGGVRAVGLVLAAAVNAGICVTAWRCGQAAPDSRGKLACCLLVALCGTMLASHHMHVQELNGLFILAALAVPCGLLDRRQLLLAATGIAVGLWVLSALALPWRQAWSLVPVLLLPLYACGLRQSLRAAPS